MTVCQRQYQEIWRNGAGTGLNVPRCNPDGSFIKEQCHASCCYCVDKNGREIPGLRVCHVVGPISCPDSSKLSSETEYDSTFYLANKAQIINVV